MGQDSGPVSRDKFGNLSHIVETRSPEAKPTGEFTDTPVSLAFDGPVRIGRPMFSQEPSLTLPALSCVGPKNPGHEHGVRIPQPLVWRPWTLAGMWQHERDGGNSLSLLTPEFGLTHLTDDHAGEPGGVSPRSFIAHDREQLDAGS